MNTKFPSNIRKLISKKESREKIVSLTAYDYFTAQIEEKAGVDFILVGDSMAMAVFGEDSTQSANLEVMLVHTKAVKKGAPETLVVGDLPCGTYEDSDRQALETAKRFVDYAGADAVKLEGGDESALARVKAITGAGIPVMGHIGLLPQTAHETGGYRVIRSAERERMFSEAKALQQVGTFAIVLESMEETIAEEITALIDVPTIGIGAGRYTDGQILVINDILGLSGDFNPKFIKEYIPLNSMILEAVREYSNEVRTGVFPAVDNVYSPGRKK